MFAMRIVAVLRTGIAQLVRLPDTITHRMRRCRDPLEAAVLRTLRKARSLASWHRSAVLLTTPGIHREGCCCPRGWS